MFITALFTIARTWKQSKCPSADEWIRKLWYTYTLEYYTAIKKNALESVLLLLSHFSRVRLCVTPSLGFSRQEHWSGLPFPSPMHKSEKWKWTHSVMSNSSRPHGLQPTRLLHPWDFPGKSTRVGCHYLLHESVLVRWKNWSLFTERSKSERKTPIPYINTYMEFRKMVMRTLYARQQRDTDIKNRLLDSVGKGEGGVIWDNSIETCILPYVK